MMENTTADHREPGEAGVDDRPQHVELGEEAHEGRHARQAEHHHQHHGREPGTAFVQVP